MSEKVMTAKEFCEYRRDDRESILKKSFDVKQLKELYADLTDYLRELGDDVKAWGAGSARGQVRYELNRRAGKTLEKPDGNPDPEANLDEG
jgi:hypothetical protein